MPVLPEKREAGGVCEGNSTTRSPPMGSDPGSLMHDADLSHLYRTGQDVVLV